MNVIAKKFRAKDKTVQKMTRDGLKTENLAEEEVSESPKLKKKMHKQKLKVERAEEKLEKAKEKVPKQKKLIKEKAYDEVRGKKKTSIKFEEVDKKPNHRQKFHQPSEILRQSGENVLHGKIYEVEKENVGVESGHLGERVGEEALRHTTRKVHSAYRQHRLKPFTEVEKAQMKLEKAEAKLRYQRVLAENPHLATNPLSRFIQKRKIQREYAREVREAGRAGSTIAQNIRNLFIGNRFSIARYEKKREKSRLSSQSIFLRLKMIQMLMTRAAIRRNSASQAHHFSAKGRVTFIP